MPLTAGFLFHGTFGTMVNRALLPAPALEQSALGPNTSISRGLHSTVLQETETVLNCSKYQKGYCNAIVSLAPVPMPSDLFSRVFLALCIYLLTHLLT